MIEDCKVRHKYMFWRSPNANFQRFFFHIYRKVFSTNYLQLNIISLIYTTGLVDGVKLMLILADFIFRRFKVLSKWPHFQNMYVSEEM